MEVGDDKKKVKLITRAMTPLIFGTAFVLCSLLYTDRVSYRGSTMNVILLFLKCCLLLECIELKNVLAMHPTNPVFVLVA